MKILLLFIALVATINIGANVPKSVIDKSTSSTPKVTIGLTLRDRVYVHEIGALINEGTTKSIETACNKIKALEEEFKYVRGPKHNTPTVDSFIDVVRVLVLMHIGKNKDLDWQLELLTETMILGVRTEDLPGILNELGVYTLVRDSHLGSTFVDVALNYQPRRSLNELEKLAPWALSFAKNYVSYIGGVNAFKLTPPLKSVPGWLFCWEYSTTQVIKAVPHTLSIDAVGAIIQQSRELLEFSQDPLYKLVKTHFTDTKNFLNQALSKAELDPLLTAEVGKACASIEALHVYFQKDFAERVGQVAKCIKAQLPNMTKISARDREVLLTKLGAILPV